MKTITRDDVKQLRDEINAALSAVAEKHGLHIAVGNANFTSANVTFKLTAAVQAGTDGVAAQEAMTPEASAFKSYARKYGLNPESLFSDFSHGGRVYTVVGLKTKSYAYPILCRRDDGQVFKMSARTVLAELNHAAGN